MFPDLIISKIDQTSISKVVIERMKCSPDALAELMECTAERLSNKGLIRLNLFRFPKNCTLSPSVLQKFSTKSVNLRELTVGGM